MWKMSRSSPLSPSWKYEQNLYTAKTLIYAINHNVNHLNLSDALILLLFYSNHVH